MDRNRSWKILNWNLRGINSKKKWLALANKISESNCDIVCIQETKRESFDDQHLRNFCPKKLNKFEFIPSVGASGGIIIIWNGSLFNREVDFQNEFSLSIKFTSNLSHDSWILTNIYGPYSAERKAIFLDWFSNIDMLEDMDWLVLGDFNFMRKPSDRNKPGGDVNEMLLFNEAISNLGLVELPLKGRKFTWSNMQQEPLLERLDWFFTSSSWTLSYPSTLVFPLVKPTSDHVSCVIAIGTKIPKAKIFRFENYWLEHSDFKQVVQNIWNIPVGYSDSAKKINAKLKNLRRGLKLWAKILPCLKNQIQKTNEVIELLDIIEEMRTLTLDEWNLRDALKAHIITLLQNQRTYWKQRGKIKWVKLGNENTRFFHTKATINYRHNLISMLKNADQAEICDHDGKAHIL
jgi:exonuclease III